MPTFVLALFAFDFVQLVQVLVKKPVVVIAVVEFAVAVVGFVVAVVVVEDAVEFAVVVVVVVLAVAAAVPSFVVPDLLIEVKQHRRHLHHQYQHYFDSVVKAI